MDAAAFDALVATLRASPGIAAKADIGLVAERLGLAGAVVAEVADLGCSAWRERPERERAEVSDLGYKSAPLKIPVGDDCAAIPDGDGHLLFAIEGFMNEFVAADPWFAGWCGVMVNLSDIAAMGGRPLAVVDAVWANGDAAAGEILDGLRAASRAYGVPIVGGHSNLRNAQGQLAVAVLGRAGPRLLTSFDARPGDALVVACDHRGAYREPFHNFQAALEAPSERLRADLELLPEIAERGLARAAKDISQGGIPGTAAMLAESSGVAIELDLDAIIPPAGVALERWLKTFPSYGYLIAVEPANLETVIGLFRARDLHAATIGSIGEGSRVTLRHGERGALLRDFAEERLMGLGGAAP